MFFFSHFLLCLTLFHFIFRLPTTCDELKNWWRRLLSVAMSVYLRAHTHIMNRHVKSTNTHRPLSHICASCIAIGSDTLLHSCSKTTNLWLWLYGQFIDFVFYMYRIHSNTATSNSRYTHIHIRCVDFSLDDHTEVVRKGIAAKMRICLFSVCILLFPLVPF